MLVNNESDLRKIGDAPKESMEGPDIDKLNQLAGEDLKKEDFVEVDENTLTGRVMVNLPDDEKIPDLPKVEEPPFEVRPGNVDENTLAGDVMIDFPDGKSVPGILAPRGLAGSVVYPGALGNPKTPIDIPEVPDNHPFVGSIVLSPDLDSALDIIADLLEKYRKERQKEIAEIEKLRNFILQIMGQFRWDEMYLNDNKIGPMAKMDGVKDVAVNNLTSIRDAAKVFQNQLVESEEKGKTM